MTSINPRENEKRFERSLISDYLEHGSVDEVFKKYRYGLPISYPSYQRLIDKWGIIKAAGPNTNYSEVVSFLMKLATEKIDYNDRVAYNYGLVLQQLGKRKEAEEAFKSGLKINPYSESNLYALGYLYFEQKRFNEARQVLETLVRVAPQNQQYQQLLQGVMQSLQ